MAVLEKADSLPFVEAAAARAPGKWFLAGVFEEEGANGAPDPVAHRKPLPPLPFELITDPEAEHRGQKHEEIDENQETKTDAEHEFKSLLSPSDQAMHTLRCPK